MRWVLFAFVVGCGPPPGFVFEAPESTDSGDSLPASSDSAEPESSPPHTGSGSDSGEPHTGDSVESPTVDPVDTGDTGDSTEPSATPPGDSGDPHTGDSTDTAGIEPRDTAEPHTGDSTDTASIEPRDSGAVETGDSAIPPIEDLSETGCAAYQVPAPPQVQGDRVLWGPDYPLAEEYAYSLVRQDTGDAPETALRGGFDQVEIGDVDGDGNPDIIASPGAAFGDAAMPVWFIYGPVLPHAPTFAGQSTSNWEFGPGDEDLLRWMHIRVADYDQDGADDVLVNSPGLDGVEALFLPGGPREPEKRWMEDMTDGMLLIDPDPRFDQDPDIGLHWSKIDAPSYVREEGDAPLALWMKLLVGGGGEILFLDPVQTDDVLITEASPMKVVHQWVALGGLSDVLPDDPWGILPYDSDRDGLQDLLVSFAEEGVHRIAGEGLVAASSLHVNEDTLWLDFDLVEQCGVVSTKAEVATGQLTAGDVDGDGSDDLLVSGNESVHYDLVSWSHLYTGALSDVTVNPYDAVASTTLYAGTYDSGEKNYTNAVSMADLDGDGFEDVWSKHRFFYGPLVGLITEASVEWDRTPLEGAGNELDLGEISDVALGDLTGDGVSDAVVGWSTWDDWDDYDPGGSALLVYEAL